MANISGLDLSTYYSDYYTQATDVSKAALSNTLNSVNKDSSDEEMMEACKEFEAYFIEQIYKGMEKTIMKADDEENDYMNAFGDMQIQEYAKAAAEQGDGIGLAKQLFESMKRNNLS